MAAPVAPTHLRVVVRPRPSPESTLRRPSEGDDRWRRALDVTVAATGLVLTAPVLALAALALYVESPGPVLFRQPRMGRHGRPFELLKLRGMWHDARERFPELYDYRRQEVRRDATYFFHQQEDPRITPVGRFLRRYSIDELPNLVNVLRGDMALVGPRPEIPELAYLYGDSLPRLLSVLPGVTGLAKASGRDTLSFAETLELELRYVERRSLALDLRILGRTVASVLRGCDVV
jgi:lipopolysaccharide/colanic/teichoic acid biosynthesis glycosyltransferase